MKKLFSFIFIIFALPAICIAQNDDGKIWKVVEKMPQFPGGEAELINFISRNIRYPMQEISNNIQGKVYVSFVINSTGQVTDIKILKGVPNGDGLSIEAIRVLSTSPKWEPGEQNGKKVSVEYMLPISFTIRDEGKNAAYIPPSYKSGLNDLEYYLEKETSNILNNDEGIIQVYMDVEKDGKLSNVHETKKLLLNNFLNEKILTLFQSVEMQPALMNGQKIDTTVGFNIFVNKHNNELLLELNTVTLDPKITHSQIAYEKGIAYSNKSNYQRAIKFYKYALLCGYSPTDCYYNLGAAYLNLQDSADACTNWLKAATYGDTESISFLKKVCPDAIIQTQTIIDSLEKNAPQIFSLVENMPKFPYGGEEGFMKYIAMNFKYPDHEREVNITGTVFVEFVIRPDGSITDAKVLKGISGGEGLDREAVRVIEASPKWIPGTQNEKVVSVYYRVPVRCVLMSNHK